MLLFLVPGFALALGCGGGGTKPAESGASQETPAASERSRPTRAAAANDDDPTAPAPKRGACDDGTCTLCGDALCPTGWYCDESAPGGPACGWLPECAQKPGCGCVKKALAGCSCEEKSGGIHLVCK